MYACSALTALLLLAGLNPRNARVLLSRFGEIDRIYFEPGRLRRGTPVSFKEGWIEFKKKRVAKQVAATLNGSVITCRRKAAFCGSVWAMKYLHGVKWQHLSEQVNLEKVSRDQRLRLEMSRVKKQSDFFAEQTHQHRKRQKQGLSAPEQVLDRRREFYSDRQNKAEAPTTSHEASVDGDLLQRIFR